MTVCMYRDIHTTTLHYMRIILINTKYIKVSSLFSELMHEETPTRQHILFSTSLINCMPIGEEKAFWVKI